VYLRVMCGKEGDEEGRIGRMVWDAFTPGIVRRLEIYVRGLYVERTIGLIIFVKYRGKTLGKIRILFRPRVRPVRALGRYP